MLLEHAAEQSGISVGATFLAYLQDRSIYQRGRNPQWQSLLGTGQSGSVGSNERKRTLKQWPRATTPSALAASCGSSNR
jgi:hypothetical protein